MITWSCTVSQFCHNRLGLA